MIPDKDFKRAVKVIMAEGKTHGCSIQLEPIIDYIARKREEKKNMIASNRATRERLIGVY